MRNKRKDGTVYDAEVHVAPVLDNAGEITFYVGIERDITQFKELQRAKTEFISLASHNLKTPLSSVRWYTEMLLAGDAGALTSEQKEYSEEVLKASKRMAKLIERLLNISRIEMGTFVMDVAPTNVCAMVRDIIGEVESRLREKGMSVEARIMEEPCVIESDVTMVSNAVSNIVSNAIKYSPPESTLVVEVFVLSAGDRYQGQSFPDTRIVVVVQDSGPGIEPEEQHLVFNRFFRGKKQAATNVEGTGLGLYLTKEIVNHLGADVWFVSNSTGSTFCLAFPTKVKSV